MPEHVAFERAPKTADSGRIAGRIPALIERCAICHTKRFDGLDKIELAEVVIPFTFIGQASRSFVFIGYS